MRVMPTRRRHRVVRCGVPSDGETLRLAEQGRRSVRQHGRAARSTGGSLSQELGFGSGIARRRRLRVLPCVSCPPNSISAARSSVPLAASERRPAGAAYARSSAQRPPLCPVRGRVRHWDHDRVPVHHRRAVEVLAALAAALVEAIWTASSKAFVLLDGTLLPIDRVAPDRPYYPGKH